MTLEDQGVLNNTFHKPNKIPSLLRVETLPLAPAQQGVTAWHSPCHQSVPSAGTSRSQPPAAQPNCSLRSSETVAKAALATLSGSPAHPGLPTD